MDNENKTENAETWYKGKKTGISMYSVCRINLTCLLLSFFVWNLYYRPIYWASDHQFAN